MPYAMSNGTQIYYEVTGSGTPVIFIHEFAGDFRNWEQQVRFLGRHGYQCITYNARGYPPSDVPERVEDYSQTHAVEDCANVLRHLGLEKAHVVGLSMGGYASLNFAISHPEMTISAVVAGAGHGSDPAGRDEFLAASAELADRLITLGMEQGIVHYANSPIRRRYKEKDPRGFDEFNRQFAEHSALGSSLTTRGYQLRRPTIYELEEQLKAIPVPVMIITGDDDVPCLEPALFMKRHIPDARLWVVPRSSHPVNLEEPDAFNRAVLDFLSEARHDR